MAITLFNSFSNRSSLSDSQPRPPSTLLLARSARPPISLASPSPTLTADWASDRQFGVVLDAGSSGTRVQVYSWISHQTQVSNRLAHYQPTNVLPRIETGVPHGDHWQLKVEPGISSFGSHPHDVGDYLKPLLDHALTLIPPKQVFSTPFFLLATAGMRLLPESQQKAILKNACSYVGLHYRFRIRDCKDDIRVISGEEEGGFGWIAVNYLMDGFDQHDGGSQLASTFGFLDMGGASTQIAFEPNEIERVRHADNLTNLTLRLLDGTDVVHSVFITTWLGYGTNKARERYSERLLAQHRLLGVGRGKSKSEKPEEIPDPCLPTALLLPSSSSEYQFKGTGDFASCMKSVSPLLNKNAPCLDEPCLFDGKHVPPIDFSVNHFIGISEYWYSTQDLWSMGGIYDFVEFEKKAIAYCGQNWEDLVRDHKAGTRWPTTVELGRLQTQCFKAAWIINILHEGIGIPRIVDKGGKGDQRAHNEEGIRKATEKGLGNAPPSFQSLNDVGDVTVSWTLGKMVLEVSQELPSARVLAANSSSSSYTDGIRGVHTAQLGGLKAHLSGARSWFDPMALLGLTIAALAVWFFYTCTRSICLSGRRERLAGQGYQLATMEEGDRGEGQVSFTNLSRPSSPHPGAKHSWPSSPTGRLRTPTRSAQLVRMASGLHALVWGRARSPRPHRVAKATVATPEPDAGDPAIIPPVSITTSLSAPGNPFQTTSARGSFEEGAKKKKAHERLGAGTLRPHSALAEERPKQRLAHSPSYQTLPTQEYSIYEPSSPRMRRDCSWSQLDEQLKRNPGQLVDGEIEGEGCGAGGGGERSRVSSYGGNELRASTGGMSTSGSSSSILQLGKGRHGD